jgi:hypothetical protein
MKALPSEPELAPPAPCRQATSDRRGRHAALLIVQAIPLAAASYWPILESNRFGIVGEPLFFALVANCCLLGAWAALSSAKFSRRAPVLIGGCSAGIWLYATRMPYLDVDGMAFLGLSAMIVSVAVQAGRRWGLHVASAATIMPGGPPRRQFTLGSLMIFIGLLALLCGVEGAISKVENSVTWRPINVCLFSFCYACAALLSGWFLLHERRLGHALGLSAAGAFVIASAVSFSLRRGPFGGYGFVEFTLTFAQEFFAIAILQLPALVLVRLKGIRLAFERGAGGATAGRGAAH